MPQNQIVPAQPVLRERVPLDPGVDVEMTVSHTPRGPVVTVSGIRPEHAGEFLLEVRRRETFTYGSIIVVGVFFVALTVGSSYLVGWTGGLLAILALALACRQPGASELVATAIERGSLAR